MLFFAVNIIFSLHFAIILFISSLIFLIPLGYKFSWSIYKNKTLRLIHLVLMLFVTLETLLGIVCPLTLVENYLSGTLEDKTFVSYWLGKIIYWDLPSIFFSILYSTCLIWIIIMWKIFPPQKKKCFKIQNY